MVDIRAHHGIKNNSSQSSEGYSGNSFVTLLNNLCFLLVFTTTVARDSSNIHRLRAVLQTKANLHEPLPAIQADSCLMPTNKGCSLWGEMVPTSSITERRTAAKMVGGSLGR